MFCSLTRALTVIVAFLSTVSVMDSVILAETTPLTKYRTWQNQSGKKSRVVALTGFDAVNESAFFRDKNGRDYKTDFKSLSQAEQNLVRRLTASRTKVASQIDSEPLVDPPETKDVGAVEYGEPRNSPLDPIQVTDLKTEDVTVEVPYTEEYTVQVPCVRRVRCVERCGLFRKRYRIVWRRQTVMTSQRRTRTLMRTETRTRTSKIVRSIQSILNEPNAGQAEALLKLQAPKSAGAISTQVRDVLDLLFPSNQFNFNRTLNDTVVDYQQTATVNGKKVMVRVEIQSDPRQIKLQTGAVDVNNAANGQVEAQNLFDKVKNALTT